MSRDDTFSKTRKYAFVRLVLVALHDRVLVSVQVFFCAVSEDEVALVVLEHLPETLATP